MWHPDFERYMPREWVLAVRKNKVDVKFFWAIISTLSHEFVEELISECRRLRDQKKQKPEVKRFNFSQWVINMLLEHPYKSGKWYFFSYIHLPVYLATRAGNQSILIEHKPKAERKPYVKPAPIVPTVRMSQILRR